MKSSPINTALSRMPPHTPLGFLLPGEQYLRYRKAKLCCSSTTRSIVANISTESLIIGKTLDKHFRYNPPIFNKIKSWYAHLS